MYFKYDISIADSLFSFLKNILVCVLCQTFRNYEQFISKFLLVNFFRKSIFCLYYHFTYHSSLLYMFIWDGLIQLGTWLLWCDFEAFLHCLHHWWMAVNDLVCLVCVCLMFSISCRISSAGGWETLSLRSESGGVLADMVIISSGWYDTSIHSSFV